MKDALKAMKSVEWRYWVISWGIGYSLLLWLKPYGVLACVAVVIVNFLVALKLIKYFKK